MRFFATLSLALIVLPSVAEAHIALVSPPPRYADLKSGPCGKGTKDARTTKVSTFKPGATINVTWQETIGHPGHFRIAFDPDGTSIFKDPASFTDVSGGPGVLVDNIADKTGTQMYTQQVTLPNVECTNCTLQVIQVMTDKAPYGDGNDLYYQCADIVLAKDALDDAGTFPYSDAGTSGSSGTSGSIDFDSGALDPDGGTIGDPEQGGSCQMSGTNGGASVLATFVALLAVAGAYRSRQRGKSSDSE